MTPTATAAKKPVTRKKRSRAELAVANLLNCNLRDMNDAAALLVKDDRMIAEHFVKLVNALLNPAETERSAPHPSPKV